MSYTPNSTPIYLRAAAGCMSGLGAGAATDTSPGDYTFYAQIADAFAQQVDTLWTGTPTNFELETLEEVCEAIWESRSPPPSDVATKAGTYYQTAKAVIARVQQANTQVVSEGIDPNDTGGGSAGPPGPPGPAGPTGPSVFSNILAAVGPVTVSPTAGQTVQCDTTAGNVTVDLPALSLGDAPVIVTHVRGDMVNNFITIVPNGAQRLNQPPPNNLATPAASYVLGGPNSSSGLRQLDALSSIGWQASIVANVLCLIP